MNTLEILMNNRWIVKSINPEEYFKVSDDINSYKKFLFEQFGYNVIKQSGIIKIEKIPEKAENWMGISRFNNNIQYAFFCLVLMFLEDKIVEYQFVLSSLTEYIKIQYDEIDVDWTNFNYRKDLIVVLKYCTEIGILKINDGSEDDFTKDENTEILYENTGTSRFFMRNFTQSIMEYDSIEDFRRNDWFDLNTDRGTLRKHRVYRKLLLQLGVYKDEDSEEDLIYIKNFKSAIENNFEKYFNCSLHVYRNCAFVVYDEESRFGINFPEDKMTSDVAILVSGYITSLVKAGNLKVEIDGKIVMEKDEFDNVLLKCREENNEIFNKGFRELSLEEFCDKIINYMKNYNMIFEENNSVIINPVVGKVNGKYSEEIRKKIKEGSIDEK